MSTYQAAVIIPLLLIVWGLYRLDRWLGLGGIIHEKAFAISQVYSQA
jgi:hypothetical protein